MTRRPIEVPKVLHDYGCAITLWTYSASADINFPQDRNKPLPMARHDCPDACAACIGTKAYRADGLATLKFAMEQVVRSY
jgi:hypothetical protein